jgi:hypothetical protein
VDGLSNLGKIILGESEAVEFEALEAQRAEAIHSL